ncbi:MAG: TonB-dependent receptor [Sphingobacteriaceae bacterium]|nr:MAG: TonB-dependent receptor [Sphingobacteriaceae bacterium]
MMVSMIKWITCIVFIMLVSAQANAQSTGKITGKLVDGKTKKVIEFATVALFNKADNSPAKAVQSDLQGNFSLNDIAEGTYLLRITSISYNTYTRDSLVISPQKNTYNLGSVVLNSATSALKEVVVTAQRSSIQLGVDKKVFSVDQSLVSQGGSATDLLSNVPSVQVDVDGNVNLRGSNNVRVLINGKPSALTGSNVSDILQSIPASSIENIEVITNPSSKYDPEGQSGIINIILKKNARLGFSGSVSGTVGNQETYNGNISLGYQTEKFNIFTNYSYRRGKRIGNGYNNRQTFIDADTLFQNQTSNQSFVFNSHNVRAGIDYNLASKTTLSLSGNINTRTRDRLQSGNTIQYQQLGMPTQQTVQDNQSTSDGTNVDLNLDFTQKFKRPQEELTANIGYSTGDDDDYDYFKTYYDNYESLLSSRFFQNNYTKDIEHNWNLQADYVLPFADKKGRFEAGYRSTLNKNDNDYLVDTAYNGGLFTRDLTQTNRFIYNEYVHALYANYQRQFGNFGLQVGVRLEDANIRTTLIDSANSNLQNKQDYFRVYPSVFLSQKLTDAQTLQLSYTRRVSRPRQRQLSPFLDRSDPFNYQQGNPTLQPEDTHSFEFSYINYWKSLTLTSSLYYRLTNNNFQRLSIALDSTRTLTRFENVNSATNAGYELIAKMNFSNTFDLTGNVNVYYRQIDGDEALGLRETSGYAWNANLTANYKPIKKLGLQGRFDYQGPQVIAQGRMKAMYGFDAGARYDITDKLNVSANARDVFNTRRFSSEIYNYAGVYPYYQNSSRRFQTRVISFTVSYRFGSTGQKKQEKKSNDSEQESPGTVPDEGGMR